MFVYSIRFFVVKNVYFECIDDEFDIIYNVVIVFSLYSSGIFFGLIWYRCFLLSYILICYLFDFWFFKFFVELVVL